MTITPELVIFFLLALVAVGAAVGMLLSRNAVHSALFLVVNFAVVAVFFLLLNAPFIAMVQVTVYAGAIMVLFLFVIMLLGAELLRHSGSVLRWQPALAGVLAALFLGVAGYVFIFRGAGGVPTPLADPKTFGGPQGLGLELYQNYLLPFELTSFLLLVAMIGAVILTRDARRPLRGRAARQAAAQASAPEADHTAP